MERKLGVHETSADGADVLQLYWKKHGRAWSNYSMRGLHYRNSTQILEWQQWPIAKGT